MAKSTKLSSKRVWVASRHKVNGTLSVSGFEDVLESQDFENFVVAETAEQRAQAFINMTPGSVLLDVSVTTAEQAIEAANQKGF